MSLNALLAVVLLAPTIAPAHAPVAAGELAILDAYLAQYDIAPGLQHCARTGGGVGPAPSPATNSLLGEHAAWVTAHSGYNATPDMDRYGDDFVSYHHKLVADYDAWRTAHGFAPVALWDPATPIPPEFAYAPGPGCNARASEDPRTALPTWATIEGGSDKDPLFGYRALCEFPDINSLAKSLDAHWTPAGSWVRNVHVRIGGDMARAATDPRDPVFWAFKKWIDGRFDEWRACAAAPAQGRAVPGLGAVSVVLIASAIGASGARARRPRAPR